MQVGFPSAYLPSIQDGTLDAVYRRWAGVYGAEIADELRGPWQFAASGAVFPPPGLVRRYARALPLTELFRAVDVTRSVKPLPTAEAAKYFLGVCRKMLARHRAEQDEAAQRRVWADGFAAGVRAQEARDPVPAGVAEEPDA